jgi:hypothetical protein
MANDGSQKKSGFFNQLLSSIGVKKEEPRPPASAPGPGSRPLGPEGRSKSAQFVRSQDTKPLSAGKVAATNPLSSQEKAKQSEERRYLISAYETTPTLIPEFQNPQYMYKLISNEREYSQEVLGDLLQRRKEILIEFGESLPPEVAEELAAIDARSQELRNDLTRLFLLIKRVAGIQKSGTGGTDFLDPLKGKR